MRRKLAERSGTQGYEAYMQAFCSRKYNSDFAREMIRSVDLYLQQFSKE